MVGHAAFLKSPPRIPDCHAADRLVSQAAVDDALTELWVADIGCRWARARLATIRERLDRVLDDAYRHQSFASLETLFLEEEAALAEHELWKLRHRSAELRCLALRAAMACERDMMASGSIQHH
jgi:hypothetical protein